MLLLLLLNCGTKIPQKFPCFCIYFISNTEKSVVKNDYFWAFERDTNRTCCRHNVIGIQVSLDWVYKEGVITMVQRVSYWLVGSLFSSVYKHVTDTGFQNLKKAQQVLSPEVTLQRITAINATQSQPSFHTSNDIQICSSSVLQWGQFCFMLHAANSQEGEDGHLPIRVAFLRALTS